MNSKLPKICPVCGKVFEARRCDKYCCGTCRRFAERKRVREKARLSRGTDTPVSLPPGARICPVCGKPFTGPSFKVYCSQECRKKQKALLKRQRSWQRRQATVIMRTCPVCGKTFRDTSRNRQRKYCSDYCKYRAKYGQRLARGRADEYSHAAVQPEPAPVHKCTRHCVDCGKPCLGYRCDGCRRKIESRGYEDF